MYWVICKCLAGVLLLAATLKLLDGQVPVSFVHLLGPEAATAAHLLVLQGEFLLGFALLLGVCKPLVHRLTVGTFLAFAAVSFWSGWVGQSDCGCFGSVAINPWMTFSFDVVAVILLALLPRYPAVRAEPTERARGWRFARVAALSVVLFNGVIVASGVQAGSVADGLTWLRGTQLSIDGAPVDVGSQAGGQTVVRVVSVRNHLSRPVRVVGGTSDCSCVATDDLPVTIPAGEAASIRVALRLPPDKPGQFARRVWLWSDADERLCVFQIIGTLVP